MLCYEFVDNEQPYINTSFRVLQNSLMDTEVYIISDDLMNDLQGSNRSNLDTM